jgi:hypothetical protein
MSAQPCERAAHVMAVFDQLPGELRAFLASYPRGIKPPVAMEALRINEGDVAEAIRELRAEFPVKRRA